MKGAEHHRRASMVRRASRWPRLRKREEAYATGSASDEANPGGELVDAFDAVKDEKMLTISTKE
jgi:hypothetical protein